MGYVIKAYPAVDCSSTGRAPACEAGGCEFKSHLSNQLLNARCDYMHFKPKVAGSNPAVAANGDVAQR